MMGQILEVTGAAKRLAYSFLRIFGRAVRKGQWLPLAMSPRFQIFCDSGFVIHTHRQGAVPHQRQNQSSPSVLRCLRSGGDPPTRCRRRRDRSA